MGFQLLISTKCQIIYQVADEPPRGKGLRTKIDFEAGDFVIEYKGRHTYDSHEAERWKLDLIERDKDCYLMVIPGKKKFW